MICRDYRDIFVTEPPKRSCQWQSIEEQGEYRQQTQRHDRPSGGFLEGWFSSRHNVTASPHAIHLKHILDFGEGQVNLGDDCRRSLQQGFGRQVTLLTNTKSQGSPSDLEDGARNLRIGLSSADFEYNMRTSLGGKILMRHIDIDSLSEDELIELNHKVVARLRFLSQMRSHSAMLDFRVGERVKFHPDGGPELLGTLTRYNKKTVTVVTDAGQHWNVSPSLLTRANPPCAATANSNGAGIARFPNRSAEK